MESSEVGAVERGRGAQEGILVPRCIDSTAFCEVGKEAGEEEMEGKREGKRGGRGEWEERRGGEKGRREGEERRGGKDEVTVFKSFYLQE